jgi:arylsulfatase A
LQAVRQGQWKLAIVSQKDGMSSSKVPEGASRTKPPLYDLGHDIGERTDVAEKHRDIVERLQVLAKRMDAELGSNGSARRPAGVVNNPKTRYSVEEKCRIRP